MTEDYPFAVDQGNGATISPVAGSAFIPIPSVIPRTGDQLCLTNFGANVYYIRTAPPGSPGPIATTADYPVPPSPSQVVITIPPDHTQIAHFSPLGTTGHLITGRGR